MKTQAVLILMLLAFSAYAADIESGVAAHVVEGTVTDGMNDLWAPDREIQVGVQVGEVAAPVVKEDTVTDGMTGLWQPVRENKMEIQDGKLVNVVIVRNRKFENYRNVEQIKTIMHKLYQIDNVLEVVRNFGAEYGKPLSNLELSLFNTIALTHGGDFQMQYIIQQVKKADLGSVLRKTSKMFSVKLGEDDIALWWHQIVNSCTEKYQVFELHTSAVEVNRPDLWTFKTEVLMATCGGEDNAGFQIFAWSASKSGAYKAIQYSPENGETLRKLVIRWLYDNMHSMIDCQKGVATLCEITDSASLSQFEISDSKNDVTPHATNSELWNKNIDRNAAPSTDDDLHDLLLESTKPDNEIWKNNPRSGSA